MQYFSAFLLLKLIICIMSSKNHNFQLKALAYVRASTNKQDINNQKLELFEYARQKRLHIDKFIEITISTRKTKKQRRIDEIMEKVKNYDVLIATELSRLGRSTTEVITIIDVHQYNDKKIHS